MFPLANCCPFRQISSSYVQLCCLSKQLAQADLDHHVTYINHFLSCFLVNFGSDLLRMLIGAQAVICIPHLTRESELGSVQIWQAASALAYNFLHLWHQEASSYPSTSVKSLWHGMGLMPKQPQHSPHTAAHSPHAAPGPHISRPVG